MYFEAHLPHPVLRPYISRYFHVRLTSGQFCFPADGSPGFIISLKDPFLLGFDQGKLNTLTGCRLFGSSTRYLMTKHLSGQTELLAVKYRPGVLSRFYNVSAAELTDVSASLGALCGINGREMEEKLCASRSISRIVRLLDDALIKCLRSANVNEQRITMALQTISMHHGQIRIGDLAAEIDLGRRHFERLFREKVGLTPKRMCRIARFLNVFSGVPVGQGVDWSDLAFAGGYSDQAHLIRECKYFTGLSPLSYLKARSSLEFAILGTDD